MKTALLSVFLFISLYSLGQVFGEEVQISNSISTPIDIHFSDIDNDGDTDFLCAFSGSGSIILYKNNGEGGFSDKTTITCDIWGISEFELFDLNQDGFEDIVASGNEEVAVFMNSGNGIFNPTNSLIIESLYWRGVSFGDIDNDGDKDIITIGNQNTTDLYWFENTGLGEFNSHHTIEYEFNHGQSIESLDIDGDGDDDIVICSTYGGGINWLENLGNSQFSEPITLSGNPNSVVEMHLTDIDGDNDTDIICTSAGGQTCFLYVNNGLGDFDYVILSGQLENPRYVASADLNNDGLEDILAASSDDNKVGWYTNLGDDNFSDFQSLSSSLVRPSCIGAIDMNNNGIYNIVATAFQNDEISIFENDGSANFSSGMILDYSETSEVTSLDISDLDGDGDLDIIAASIFNYPLSWYENVGNGEFGDQAYFDIDEDEKYESVASGDFNADGLMDLVTASFVGDEQNGVLYFRTFTQESNNEYSSSVLHEFGMEASTVRMNVVKVLDLNLDGYLDIIGINNVAGQVFWYENNGLGVFSTGQLIIENGFFALVNDVNFADLDSDGDLDAIVAKSGPSGGIVVLNNDELEFTLSSVITEENNGSAALAADMDEDGDIDIVYSLWQANLSWAANDGLGNFSNNQYLCIDVYNPRNIDLGDLDGDDDIDVVFSSTNDTNAYWIENEGNGSFGEIQIFSNKINIGTDIHMADINADGDLDVISSSRFDDKIALFPNIYGEGCTDSDACNFNPASLFDNGTCCYDNCGCTDVIAENFSETATCDDGSCTYVLGCINENAINYDQDATLDDDSCEFLISGVVYHNENLNFTQDENESGLNQQTLTIQPNNLTIITNELGEYSFITSDYQCSITLLEDPFFPIYMNPTEFVFNPHETSISNYDFGISSLEDFYGSETVLHRTQEGLCSDTSYYKVGFINTGNTPVDGIIELEMDSLFQGYSEISPLDSVNGNLIYFSFEDLAPGLAHLADIALITPTTEHIGESFTHTARVYGYSASTEISSSEKEFTAEVTCAYDPNDKQAFPLGYTDEHWLLPETEQEFLVRFQNTGNAPAQDVLIQDTIDVNYDLSTFRIVANSHSVMTTINEETRVIDFFFEDIQLPDSVNNEPESHGFVSYAITPEADLEVGTELNNTAYIYFDNNPPIITNTTWNTIHECGQEASFEASINEICAGESIDFTSLYEPIQGYEWSVNGALESVESSFSQTFEEPGEYTIELEAYNLLCNANSATTINVYEIPTVEFTQEGNLLTSSEGDSYQWFINGEAIEGAVGQQHIVSEDGTYSVVVTNGGVCSNESDGVSVLVDVSEIEPELILLYPNPMNEIAFLEFKTNSVKSVTLMDSKGKEIRSWLNVADQRLEIEKSDLSAGIYIIQIITSGKTFSLNLMVE